MIPPDAASRLRLIQPDQPLPTQPAPAAQKITDVLSDLVPGQHLLAQIQAVLPNGAYRALVGQRDVTLALPFSAKPGDSLELEVTESDGKLTLAFVANRGDGETAETAQNQSVATKLSQAGRLIGDLLTGIGDEGKRAQPAPLNGNQPLVSEMPESADQLVPLLKEALAKSGMFYESQQARWAEGKLPTSALLEQPQGKLSSLAPHPEAAAAPSSTPNTQGSHPAETAVRMEETATKPTSPASEETAAISTSTRLTNTPVHPQLIPLVQQQLDALATQTYVWQGQAWPGQEIHWEISEENHGRQTGQDETPERWQTRMNLTLPNLGGIEATLRLHSANAVEITLTTDSEASQNKLAAATNHLRQQMDASGLALTACSVNSENHGEPAT